MALQWQLLPNDVSFSRVITRERPCPRTDIKGCFRNRPQEHEPGMDFHYKENNDEADNEYDAVAGVKSPTSINPARWYGINDTITPPVEEMGGQYTWVIPWQWRVSGTDSWKGNLTAPTTYSITETGVMTIDKLGQTVTGNPTMTPP